MPKRVDLVFRTVGERTSDLALDLARESIEPDAEHVIDGVRPLSEAVRQMMRIDHEADVVVYVDADCLVFDRLRPYIEAANDPYVDCYVSDRFRGRIHCGVHITRADVVRAMARVHVPAGDPSFEIRPESRRRNEALKAVGLKKHFRNFDILHDFFQHYDDVFAKYAVRQLRSRSDHQRARLEMAMEGWPASGDPDFDVARRGVEHARSALPPGAAAEEVEAYLRALPALALSEVAALGLARKGPLSRAEVDALRRDQPAGLHRPTPAGSGKIFGIGLSRTGTRSLNVALQVLGYESVHYPADPRTFEELADARYALSVLETHDAITDITVSPYYAQLDRQYPGSKFVLTLRERAGWLTSARNHWTDRPAFLPTSTPEQETYMKVRRLLRAAVYGCYDFEAERFAYAYELHERNVRDYFGNRPEDLLVLDICAGGGWKELCEFLGRPVPHQPFPHKGRGLSDKLREISRGA